MLLPRKVFLAVIVVGAINFGIGSGASLRLPTAVDLAPGGKVDTESCLGGRVSLINGVNKQEAYVDSFQDAKLEDESELTVMDRTLVDKNLEGNYLLHKERIHHVLNKPLAKTGVLILSAGMLLALGVHIHRFPKPVSRNGDGSLTEGHASISLTGAEHVGTNGNLSVSTADKTNSASSHLQTDGATLQMSKPLIKDFSNTFNPSIFTKGSDIILGEADNALSLADFKDGVKIDLSDIQGAILEADDLNDEELGVTVGKGFAMGGAHWNELPGVMSAIPIDVDGIEYRESFLASMNPVSRYNLSAEDDYIDSGGSAHEEQGLDVDDLKTIDACVEAIIKDLEVGEGEYQHSMLGSPVSVVVSSETLGNYRCPAFRKEAMGRIFKMLGAMIRHISRGGENEHTGELMQLDDGSSKINIEVSLLQEILDN